VNSAGSTKYLKNRGCDLDYAVRDGEYLSEGFIWKFGDCVYYVYGTYLEKSWNLKALLHWEIIREAGLGGGKSYNM